jgi:hypothetical protein
VGKYRGDRTASGGRGEPFALGGLDYLVLFGCIDPAPALDPALDPALGYMLGLVVARCRRRPARLEPGGALGDWSALSRAYPLLSCSGICLAGFRYALRVESMGVP